MNPTGAPQTNFDDYPQTPLERLRFVRDVVMTEANALISVGESLDSAAVRAGEITADCTGSVIVTGMGKAGLIGKKLVATLSSTGSPAHFLHPAEAIHGDLGRIRHDDIVWALSNSGRSEELTRILPILRERTKAMIAITADTKNPLAAAADCVVVLGNHLEACPLGLAPSSSTTTMLAVGDAIALLASRLVRFSQSDFARFHPGGSLGRKLASVDQLMRPLGACRIASAETTVRQTLVSTAARSRRTGLVMLTDQQGRLTGLFTDSDLARLLESTDQDPLGLPIASVMTKQFQSVRSGTLLNDAIAILAGRRISELPVVDSTCRPLGLIDITDIVSLTETDDCATIPIRSRQSQ